MINETAVTDRTIAKGVTEAAVCARLRELARHVPADQAIVELGAYMGRTTGWLALGASEGKGAQVTAVDPWDLRPAESWPEDYWDNKARGSVYGAPETYEGFKAHMVECGIDARTTNRGNPQVVVRRGYAANVGATWGRGHARPIGLIFHDAEHTAEAIEEDLTAWAPHVVPGGWIVLHDAGNPSFGVVEGARRVLDNKAWDWAGRELMRWRKKPQQRGALLVQRVK